MSDDMSDIMSKLSGMLKNNEFPDDIKNMMNNFSNSNSQNSNSSDTDTSSIDFDTILKMKNIVDSMNKQKNDPRANLLKSLKPYLRETKQEKLDQYVNLLKVSQIAEVLKNDKKDDKNA